MKKQMLGLFVMLVMSMMTGATAFAAGEESAGKTGGELTEYYSVDAVMKNNGYSRIGEAAYKNIINGKSVMVNFDTVAEICYKNEYEFSLSGLWADVEGELHADQEVFEAVLNRRIKKTGENTFISIPLTNEHSSWLEHPHLIAHAGGGVRSDAGSDFYTNSKEALVQNYNLGHRVFEFDMRPTTDGDLALVHEWSYFGDEDESPWSAKEWKKFEAYGDPKSERRFTTMLIGDLLDEMLINEDMYIVTDGKMAGQGAKEEFEIIYKEAAKRDLSLLDRVVPQIYHHSMYEIVMDIYPFPSIIYTTYGISLPADEIISFAELQDNIDVITADHRVERFSAEDVQRMHNSDILFFTHTVNSYTDIANGMVKSVDGFYTDLLLPQDLVEYEHIR